LSETLAVMAKAPRAGQVKTRLHAALGEARATALYRCMLRDTFALAAELRAARPGMCVTLSFAPHDALGDLDAMGLGYDTAVAQRGDDLGARIADCFAQALTGSSRPVVVIGADSPTLPVARLVEAFEALARRTDVVLGPTDDGGYYLVGAGRVHDALFRDIAWSTDRVLVETRARAERLGLELHELERWYDVDEAADVARLWRDSGRRRATRAFFETLPARYRDRL
jgi:uncharacterized protein